MITVWVAYQRSSFAGDDHDHASVAEVYGSKAAAKAGAIASVQRNIPYAVPATRWRTRRGAFGNEAHSLRVQVSPTVSIRLMVEEREVDTEED